MSIRRWTLGKKRQFQKDRKSIRTAIVAGAVIFKVQQSANESTLSAKEDKRNLGVKGAFPSAKTISEEKISVDTLS